MVIRYMWPWRFPRVTRHSPITNHNIQKLTRAEDLRPISANAILWHTLWWWLDQTASTYNKLRTPNQSLHVCIQDSIAIPHYWPGTVKRRIHILFFLSFIETFITDLRLRFQKLSLRRHPTISDVLYRFPLSRTSLKVFYRALIKRWITS